MPAENRKNALVFRCFEDGSNAAIKEARLSYMGHTVMENQNGLLVKCSPTCYKQMLTSYISGAGARKKRYGMGDFLWCT